MASLYQRHRAKTIGCLGVIIASASACAASEDWQESDVATLEAALVHPESQCGPTWDVQDVEQYDGTAGVSIDWVRRHESPVGMLTRGCSGTLISNDLFLSAGHCQYVVGDTVQFDNQRDPSGTLRSSHTYRVTEIVEQLNDNEWDYAIVRLANNPGKDFGFARIANLDPAAGSRVGIIQHPDLRPKGVHAGAIVDYSSSRGANWFRHSVDTIGGSSGSGVLSESGYLIGVHTNAGCVTGTPEQGNSAIRMSRLLTRSATLQRLVKHVYVSTPRTWTAANVDCTTRGGHLVTIADAAENQLVYDLLRAQGGSRVWLGYTDAGHEGQWRWVTGEPSNYSAWSAGEPNNANGNEHYAHLSSWSPTWNDLPDNWTMPYVCEFGDYEVVPANTSWTGAYDGCVARGGHLVSIASSEENELVRRLATRSGMGRIWLGFTDAGHEGTWTWMSGEATTYSNWNTGEPNNAGGTEHYAELSSSSGRWNDLSVDASVPYVCEYGKYRFLKRARTWQQSRIACQSAGARLVSISHSDENRLVSSLVASSFHVWLGLTDEAGEGQWRWLSGEALRFTNWNAGEPNNANGIEHYAEMAGSRWNDLPNNWSISSLCEQY